LVSVGVGLGNVSASFQPAEKALHSRWAQNFQEAGKASIRLGQPEHRDGLNVVTPEERSARSRAPGKALPAKRKLPALSHVDRNIRVQQPRAVEGRESRRSGDTGCNEVTDRWDNAGAVGACWNSARR